MIHCAVIGTPISHSLSPMIHQHFANQVGLLLDYRKIYGDEQSFETQVTEFFKEQGRGLNITLPYKERAFAMANRHSSRCLEARAANTLWQQNGELYADNTDGVGLLRDLARFMDVAGKKIVILGAGGAARGIIGPLLSVGARITVINRTIEKAMALASDFPQIQYQSSSAPKLLCDVIINATSASLSGISLHLGCEDWPTKPFCYDLAYQIQDNTPFVASARAIGCLAHDGLGMLIEQAAEAFYLWHNVMPDTKALHHHLRTKKM